MNSDIIIRDNDSDLDDILSVGEPENKNKNKNKECCNNDDINNNNNNNRCCNWLYNYLVYLNTDNVNDSDNSLICLYCNSCGVCIHNISYICDCICDDE